MVQGVCTSRISYGQSHSEIYGEPLVDYYYGPPEWKAEAEAEKPADELVRDAMALEDTLAEQGFEAHRATY